MNALEQVEQGLERGISYIERSGICTRDIADLKGLPFVIRSYVQPSLPRKIGRWLIYGAALHFPGLMGRLLRVPRKPTAGGVAALAHLYCDLFELTQEETYLCKARDHLDWLAGNHAQVPVGLGWGFPFDWYTGLNILPDGSVDGHCLVPAGTPIGHTTMTCANAFLAYYRHTRDRWARDVADGCCRFLSTGLNCTHRQSGAAALSYTPLDHKQVINSNADIASLLLRTGRLVRSQEYVDLGYRLAQFVIETQNDGGSWYYYAEDYFGGPSTIDGYHTGMNLSALIGIIEEAKRAGEEFARCLQALERGTDFYLRRLFTPEGLPCACTNSVYPLNSYAFAQGLITLIDVTDAGWLDDSLRSRARDMTDKLLDCLLRLMQDPDGSFITIKYRAANYRLKSLRWSQALICRALARYCLSRSGRVQTWRERPSDQPRMEVGG